MSFIFHLLSTFCINFNYAFEMQPVCYHHMVRDVNFQSAKNILSVLFCTTRVCKRIMYHRQGDLDNNPFEQLTYNDALYCLLTIASLGQDFGICLGCNKLQFFMCSRRMQLDRYEQFHYWDLTSESTCQYCTNDFMSLSSPTTFGYLIVLPYSCNHFIPNMISIICNRAKCNLKTDN